jgi:hypothetical protein
MPESGMCGLRSGCRVNRIPRAIVTISSEKGRTMGDSAVVAHDSSCFKCFRASHRFTRVA